MPRRPLHLALLLLAVAACGPPVTPAVLDTDPAMPDTDVQPDADADAPAPLCAEPVVAEIALQFAEHGWVPNPDPVLEPLFTGPIHVSICATAGADQNPGPPNLWTLTGDITIESAGLLDPDVELALESGTASLSTFPAEGGVTVDLQIRGQTQVEWNLVVDCADPAALTSGTCASTAQLTGLQGNQFVQMVVGTADLALSVP